MIRNVVVGVARDGVSREQVQAALDALLALEVPGVELRMVAGLDLGLREGNASWAITCDLADEAAYRTYDEDAEHNRIRRELFAPIAASIQRIQIALPEGTPQGLPEGLAEGLPD